MAQNVGTPRFYVSVLQWLDAMGLMEYVQTGYMTGAKTPKQLVHINPTSQGKINIGDSGATGEKAIYFINQYQTYDKIMPNDKNFTMVLGHNFGVDTDVATGFQSFLEGNISPTTTTAFVPIGGSASSGYVNHEADGQCSYDGFSITHGNDAHDVTGVTIQFLMNQFQPNHDYKIGSILYGTYYDMPHSPDLSLKMSVEMDGVKNIQTKGGSTLSSASYTKPPNWGDSGAWQLGKVWNFRHGRRSWDLSFSYLSDTDIMAKVAASTNIYASGGEISYDVSSNDAVQNTLRTESDFFSVVWNKTMGGHLPFVFQPNGDNYSPDQFAICRFDMKSLQYDQVANNVYNVKLKIRECW